MTSSDTRATENLASSLEALDEYVRREDYRGYDPYDALSSPLFRLPLLNTSQLLRLSVQQVLKRLPFNIRPLLSIPKGLNPVTLGLAIQAYSSLAYSYPDRRQEYEELITRLIGRLEGLVSAGYSGACWGYDFDWEARYARIPAYTPTVVATGIITNGLFECHRLLRNERALNLCLAAVRFVRNDLHKTLEKETFCYSYSPLDHQVVLNATMKGARLLSQVYSVTKEQALVDEATRTVAFVVNQQRADGSWAYSKGDSRTWVDNFHTGYVLDCLHEYALCTGIESFQGSYRKGYKYYRETFVSGNEIPKYFSDRLHPIDATAIAQTILTLTRNGDGELAANVAAWTIRNFQHPSGYMYYQKHKLYTNTISYMRWSNAWMLLAFAFLLCRPSA